MYVPAYYSPMEAIADQSQDSLSSESWDSDSEVEPGTPIARPVQVVPEQDKRLRRDGYVSPSGRSLEDVEYLTR